ncbi:hypothetical protein LTR37_016226 [Vermiconidia calcicola]|uniref:Uncharacterized protein n=1 Tax=Vermiconidia calcicola TaxID=1690605 RepID=A0ACC3MQ44_9PEZI|nr:hypothetical protein LTR37_016226 [Vermiconidia calcicola]
MEFIGINSILLDSSQTPDQRFALIESKSNKTADNYLVLIASIMLKFEGLDKREAHRFFRYHMPDADMGRVEGNPVKKQRNMELLTNDHIRALLRDHFDTGFQMSTSALLQSVRLLWKHMIVRLLE